MHIENDKSGRGIFAIAAAIAVGIFCSSSVPRLELTASESVLGPATGYPQLMSIQQLPSEGEMCAWDSPGANPYLMASLEQDPNANLFAALQQEQRVSLSSPAAGDSTTEITRPAARILRDTDPIFSSVAVDTQFDEVVLQDNNLWATMVYKRTDNTPPDAPFTEPQRVIKGQQTDIQFNNGLYIDPKLGEISSIESDTGDKIVTFSHDSVGNVAPIRFLKTPHRGYAVAADEQSGELFVTVEYPPKVMIYRKGASGTEAPIRSLQGEHTGLESTHGIAIDAKNKQMFVNNWGNYSNFKVAGTGKFNLPSITVYPLSVDGDTPPTRVIQGPKTQLNWPSGMSIDPNTGDLYVANDVGNSILVFKSTDKGDVAPSRIIKGNKTGLSNPTGVSVDAKNREVWVANLGNSSATCYSLNANGDVAPVRTIRAAPKGKVSLKFGKTEAAAYDPKRDEILVPN
jgi:hypothetical protein